MTNVRCVKCGEPWDYYGIPNGDMDENEARKFMSGDGCPCCAFGTQCPYCQGTGFREQYPHTCRTCWDRGYILAWTPRQDHPQASYKVNVFYASSALSTETRSIPEPSFDIPVKIGVREFPEKIEILNCLGGQFERWWVPCPDCDGPGPNSEKCTECAGTGKLVTAHDSDLNAARDELHASDEDPVDILERREGECIKT
jgi:hypothetical protein